MGEFQVPLTPPRSMCALCYTKGQRLLPLSQQQFMLQSWFSGTAAIFCYSGIHLHSVFALLHSAAPLVDWEHGLALGRSQDGCVGWCWLSQRLCPLVLAQRHLSVCTKLVIAGTTCQRRMKVGCPDSTIHGPHAASQIVASPLLASSISEDQFQGFLQCGLEGQ